MITILALFYAAYAFVYFYSYRSGYSLLRYMYKRKNINVYLSIELIFFIFTSLVVFTNQPLNWIVAILMFIHLIGIAWLVANPKNFYEMVEESMTSDENLIENTVVGYLLMSSILVLFSRIIF